MIENPRFRAGTVIDGQWVLEAALSRGSVSEIYRSRPALGEGDKVAIKILLADVGPDRPERRIAYFLREAAVTSLVNHPSVVELYEVGYDETVGHFLVLEYLEGQTLEELVARDGPFSEGGAREIVCQILGALSAAHRMGVIHRDLKPGNVKGVETEDGLQVKLFDFGIATLFDESPAMKSLTDLDQIVGTPSWMSPEQCRGLELDERSDIYAVGATLYHLVTGRSPFPHGNVLKVLNAVLTEMPEPVGRVREELDLPILSRTIQKAIERSLQKNADQRFIDAAHFQAFLDRETPSVQWSSVPSALIMRSSPTDRPGLIAIYADSLSREPVVLGPAVEEALEAFDHDVMATIEHAPEALSLVLYPGPAPSITAIEATATALRLFDRLEVALPEARVRLVIGVGDPTLGQATTIKELDSTAPLLAHLHDVAREPVAWSGGATVTASGTYRMGGLIALTDSGVFTTPEWTHELRQDFDIARLVSGLHSLARVLGIRDPEVEPSRTPAEDLVLEALCGQHHGMAVSDLEGALHLLADPIEVLSAISDLQASDAVRIDSAGRAHVVPRSDESYPPTHLPAPERRLLALRAYSQLARRVGTADPLGACAENLESGHRLSAVRSWARRAQRGRPDDAVRCLYRALRLLATRTPSREIAPIMAHLEGLGAVPGALDRGVISD